MVAQDVVVRPRTEVQGTAYDSDASVTEVHEDASESSGSDGNESE